MPPRKLSATKNILRGKITIKSSCLTLNERNYLIVAATAFLADPNTLLGVEELEKMTEYLMGQKRRDKVRSGVAKFYSVIQSMATDGEHLSFEDIPVVPLSDIDRQRNKLLEQNYTKQINGLREELDVSRKQYHELVESLVVQQRKDAKEYFESLKPYKRTHERRFDFEVKKPYTNKEVVERLRELYGDEYDYTQVDYKNNRKPITLRCKKHNVVFSRTLQNLLKGWGCPACNKEHGKTWANVIEKTYDPSRRSERWTTERFIAESKAYHGEDVFDYSQCHYVNNDTPVTLIRIADGAIIRVLPYEHLRHDADYGIAQRYFQGTTDKEKIYFLVRRLEENIETPIYVPMQKMERTDKRFKCVCPLHDEFYTSLFKIRNGKCCPECDGSGESVGERNVRRYLQSKNIKFEQEYRIEDKKYFDTFVRVDFYLPDLNTMIEFQGEQHYGIEIKTITHGSRKWQSQKKRDNHLRRYAADHNVRLIEVPYTYRSNVDTFLAEQGIA